jgi:hypothetical protein
VKRNNGKIKERLVKIMKFEKMNEIVGKGVKIVERSGLLR